MSIEKSKPATGGKGSPAPVERAKANPAPAVPAGPVVPSTPERKPHFFRPCDWFSFAITTLLVFVGYYLTLAPDLTLEDSGELAVGSFYAGVPHPPGYPVWTIYTWLFTVLVPVSNIAWRVALSSAVAAALASGFLALITSRGSSMILESLEAFKDIDRKSENLLCIVAGWVAGLLIAFNGYMWSQAVIAEVYTLSVLSLMLTLVFLLRWLYEPDRARWLMWTFFLFGICFTNHQTLICAAMGIEVLIAFARPKLGRDLLLTNSLVYFAGLLAKAFGILSLFQDNKPVFIIFNIVGIASLHAFIWLSCRLQLTTRLWVTGAHVVINLLLIWAAMRKGSQISEVTLAQWMFWVNPVFLFATYGVMWLSGLAVRVMTEWRPILLMGLAWIVGVSFYLYMPLASMTNPPMNWGYPRTVEGFIHAFTRGQYEKTNPTDSIVKFAEQCWMLFEGVVEEFSPVYLLIAILPLVFLARMRQRERAWLIGQVAIYMCLSFLLIYLLNPNSDKQSHDLTRVFFTASHVMIAMCAGYGIALIAGMLRTQYARFRVPLLIGGLILSAVSVLGVFLVYGSKVYWLDRFVAVFGLAMMVLITGVMVIFRERVPLGLFLGLVALTPAYSVMSHWSDNEQHEHLFGWYFGHDMFTPPFNDAQGKVSYDPAERAKRLANPETAKLVYPAMTRDAILFGGTDPGRFAPTYMIFCESFIKPEQQRAGTPHFDRRDVYIITQNALADHTYLSYIRAHYNRSTQKDGPFFQGLLLSARNRTQPADQQWNLADKQWLSKLMLLKTADRVFTDLGAKIEARRRAEGVYPPAEIYTPTPWDSQNSFDEYLQDAGRRKQLNQLRPGEIVDIVPMPDGNNRVQVNGQVSVMAINGILAKVIFEKNPTNEFFVEESFPLDWMFPHLTPFGIIMKINREPVKELTEDVMLRDRQFWKQYSERLIGNWINEKTSIEEICNFVEKVYTRRDYSDFKGDPKFIRDDQAQKSFSKLRGAIAGMYLWRLGVLNGVPTDPAFGPKSEAARERLMQEAEFAWKQSFAFCPYSPEAVFKYAGLLINLPGRLPDALRIARTALAIDPKNEQFAYLLREIERYQGNESSMNELQKQVSQLVANFQKDPGNVTSAFALASAYAQMQQSNAALTVLERMIGASNISAEAVVQAAMFARELRNVPLMERALVRLSEVNPQSPEAWYDLAAMQASLGKLDAAVQNVGRSLILSDQRRRTNPGSKDLRAEVAKEERFTPLRTRPDWSAATQPP